MQSIVVALDEPFRERVEDAAGEIKAVTGRKDLPHATRPHFTLHVAERYSPDIHAALSTLIAREAVTFETGQVGVFRGPSVVVAMEIVRTNEALWFHERLLEAVAPLAVGAKPAYDTRTWAPHVSIVAGSIEETHIEAILSVLALRDFQWRMRLTNICLVPGPRTREWVRFDAGGSATMPG